MTVLKRPNQVLRLDREEIETLAEYHEEIERQFINMHSERHADRMEQQWRHDRAAQLRGLLK